jgi:hypothetical protein
MNWQIRIKPVIYSRGSSYTFKYVKIKERRVAMSERIRHFFVYGNTAQGFADLLPTNLQGINRLIVLRGWPGAAKTCLMNNIFKTLEKKGLALDCLHSPSDPDLLDGILLPEAKSAIFDGNPQFAAGTLSVETLPVDHVEYIDVDPVFDGVALNVKKGTLSELLENIKERHENAYRAFQEALSIHDEWERFYIGSMSFSEADALKNELIDKLLGDRRDKKAAVVKHRFFGTSTPKGSFDYVANLTGFIPKRYFLKGRPGTGKSTLLKKLASVSAERGLDVEVYHCGFDSNSLDMLLWPELDICLFDSTAPHLYEPERPNDEVVDMYLRCVSPGTDERYEQEISGIAARYKDAISKGTQFLSEAKAFSDELKNMYFDALDAAKAGILCEEIVKKLLAE